MTDQAPFVIIRGFLDWFYDVYLEEHPGETITPRGILIQKYYAYRAEQAPQDDSDGIAKTYTFEQIAGRHPIRINDYITTVKDGV